MEAIPENEGEIIYITIYKENSGGELLMAARFLPDHRLAFMDARPGSMCACNMSKDKWALYTGVLYYIGRAFTWENIPLPFHPGDILYNPNRPEGMFCGGAFIAVETKSHLCRGGHTRGTEHGQQTAENQNYFQLPEKQKETASEANSGELTHSAVSYFQNPN